ncbi:cation:proton antiporter [Streptomyces antarcticus]|uniref:cation:proton antiporter n=1 Tax=Streptomyces antarcticus TaxID=2996458 RepID=UPI0022721017|nr:MULTISPECIES: cation:proton antiporter [unclassified Streptomyces]MCY0941762.1 cation:proton antiporter [Streptomyces sp. H34-AA3]MCZ4081528.1 cation:proton antiporter [Streptomyces sp. H34-S5]
MSSADPMPALLVAVPVVILACQAGAALFRRFGQPPVVGEIATGILLGPSLLGWLWPDAQHWLFPPAVLPYTSVLGQLGLLAFMFLVGLELDLKSLRGHTRVAVAVSQAGMLLPLVLGALLAVAMYGDFAPDGVGQVPFTLFIAVAMSITAFPVLARILIDRGLYGTPLGALAMACAAVDDVVAWCLLALVVALSSAGSPMEAATTAALAVAFTLVMFYLVRPLLARWAARAERYQDGIVLVALFSGLSLSALATDRIGVHALFGAFLFGVVTPRTGHRIEASAARLRAFTVPVLLPLFFVHTGLRTDIGGLTATPELWLWAGAILVVAVLGKWGGATAAARACGRPWRESMSIGALMNCRGLTELVVLNVGLELGVIGPELFTMLVLMALVTTAVTSPALTLLRSGKAPRPAAPVQPVPENALSGP